MTAPATVQEFNLRSRIREVMSTSATADPHAIADEVLARIDTSDAMVALEQAMPDYVRMIVGADRRTAPTTKPGQTRSWKIDGARRYAESMLRKRVDVPGGGWKFLAECGADDVRTVASKRREQASELAETAAWYEKIAALLDEHSSPTVADLPESVLLSLATNGEVQQ